MLATLRPDALRGRELEVFRDTVVPEPVLTVSEWADAHRVLSGEASAEPGPWRTDRAPYLRGIMDAFSDLSIETVVLMKSSQVGGTEVILNVVGYYVDQDPAPILVVQPNEKPMGHAFSKDRLTPMFRDSPALRDVVSPVKSRDSGNTILHKSFAGGHLTIVGANSPAGLASRPIRVALFDEVDRYGESAGSEGDPVSLGRKRATTFWNRKVGLISTPGIRGVSRIESAHDEGDQRKYYVPCPSCGLSQVLRWKGLVWDTDAPETAAYCCGGGQSKDERELGAVGCGVLIQEEEKGRMLGAGEWVAAEPGGRIASFHLNALYSPWARWSELAEEFLKAKDDRERLMTFVNTVLGETWEEKGERLGASDLEKRAEVWVRSDGTAIEVPDGVGVLTAGVDVQKDRFEVLVRGYGLLWETWDVFHERVHGDIQLEDTRARLRAVLARAFVHAGGGQMWIRSAMVDTGYETAIMYQFVKPIEGGNVWASKGDDGLPRKELLSRALRPNKAGVRPWSLGTFSLKRDLFNRLQVEKPGPRYVHLRAASADVCNGFDSEYFAQFGAEKVVIERGKPRFKQLRDRNEAIDLHVLADAAYRGLGAGVLDIMGELVEQARRPPAVEVPPSAAAEEGPDWATGGGRWGVGL